MFGRFSRARKVIFATGSIAAALSYLAFSGNEQFYKVVVMPAIRSVMDAETAHVFAVKTAARGLVPKAKENSHDKDLLKTNVFGINFANPVGLSAGFDKNAECIDGMLKIGFGFVEVGSVTPKPQEGNAKPRVFRLVEDKAVINRYGFNSDGLELVKARLTARALQKEYKYSGVVGVNVGKNKTVEDPVADFVKGVEELGEFADYIVINVSSPNTPGLRKMQGKKELTELISNVLASRDKLSSKKPLLIKIAPDLTDEDKADIAGIAMREDTKVDGLIVSNTTISRPLSLRSANKAETGGLSGEPLREISTKAVSDMYKLTNGHVPIIGVGGILSGQDAYEKIRAGASLVQIYTVMTYDGPPVVTRIRRELAELLRKDGYESVTEAVGADHHKAL
eukprot:gene19006-20918_t